MDELQGVIQIIKIPMEFGEIAVRLAGNAVGGTARGIDSAVRLAFHMREQVMRQRQMSERIKIDNANGEMPLETLNQKYGGDLHMLRFREEQLDRAKEYCKAWNIDYSVADNLNQYNGYREVFFGTNQYPLMEEVAKRTDSEWMLSHPEDASGRYNHIITTLEHSEDLDSEHERQFDENKEKLLKQMSSGIETVPSEAVTEKLTTPSEAITEKLTSDKMPVRSVGDEQTKLLRFELYAEHPDYRGFSLDKKMLQKETEKDYTFRIPSTDSSMTINKENCLFLNNKTYVIYMHKDNDIVVTQPDHKQVKVKADELSTSGYFVLRDNMSRSFARERARLKKADEKAQLHSVKSTSSRIK